jgi:hypothetical protein
MPKDPRREVKDPRRPKMPFPRQKMFSTRQRCRKMTSKDVRCERRMCSFTDGLGEAFRGFRSCRTLEGHIWPWMDLPLLVMASQGRRISTACKSIYHKVVPALCGGSSGRMNRVIINLSTFLHRFSQCKCSPENHRDFFFFWKSSQKRPNRLREWFC